MAKVVDLTASLYSRLTVLKRVENDKNGKSVWLCRCECGEVCTVRGTNLTSGFTKSCGCRQGRAPKDHSIPAGGAKDLDTRRTETYAKRAAAKIVITVYQSFPIVAGAGMGTHTFGFAVAVGDDIPRIHGTPIMLTQLKTRQTIQGPVQIIVIRMLELLAGNNVIPQQAGRSYIRWMEECDIVVAQGLIGDAICMDREYAEVRARYGLPA